MHLLASTPWYASGTSLSVYGLVAGIIVGAGGIWASFRSQNPRQELTWQTRSVVPLLTRSALSNNDVVEIRVNGKALTNPHTVEVLIRNRGRKDIPTAAFDRARPFQLDVRAPVVDVLQMHSKPASYAAPVVKVSGSAFLIGPDLLKRGQEIAISLLVDGADPHVTAPEVSLIDVNVREDRGERGRSTVADVARTAAAVLLALILVEAFGDLGLLALIVLFPTATLGWNLPRPRKQNSPS